MTKSNATTAAVNTLRFDNGRLVDLSAQEGRWTVGSDAAVDIRININGILPHHAVLERRSGGALILSAIGDAPMIVDGNKRSTATIRVDSQIEFGTVVVWAEKQTNMSGALLGQSPIFRSAVERALKVAVLDCSILILGETGTGKELMAKAIHQASPRSSGPFIAINCGAIPRELIASELFGHDKGAFTGAVAAQPGVFAQAHGGTLFLDEIGELPIDQQAHLLRVLETRRVRPVGGTTEMAVDVRILAATHRTANLGQEDSSLRLDVYHRIATVVVTLPPLRERPCDIGLLVYAMLDELAEGEPAKQPSAAALRSLVSYRWPGNVRELKHACARAVALGGPQLELEDFLPDVIAPVVKYDFPSPTVAPLAPYEELMRQAMGKALVRKGTIRGAARELGMPKSTFAQRAKTFGLLLARDASDRKNSP